MMAEQQATAYRTWGHRVKSVMDRLDTLQKMQSKRWSRARMKFLFSCLNQESRMQVMLDNRAVDRQ